MRDGRTHERTGCIDEAVKCYEAAIVAAEHQDKRGTLAEALRRLGVVHHNRNERTLARALVERSFQTATQMGDQVLAAEAVNTLAGFDVEAGLIASAREKFYQALELGKASAELRGRTEQNLGVLANIQGALAEAFAHYQQSLIAFESTGDDRGCAIAYHNLGMVSADRELWDEADRYYARSFEIAESIGDIHLQGLGLLNHAEVHLARQHYDLAKQDAEAALGILGRLNSEEGLSVLLVEQNANLAMDIADRAYLLETGTIVASGDAETIRNDDAIRKAYLGY